jgi:hypothetical protein
MQSDKKIIMVGDNPFHGISHVSQEKAVLRGRDILVPEKAAEIVATALDNGADAFTFTVDDTILAILECLHSKKYHPPLYAFAPYSYEYVRLAVSLGGIPGLAKRVAGQIIRSRNFSAILHGTKGVLAVDPAEGYKAYICYEVGRIRAAAKVNNTLKCLLLHQVVTDMALALDMQWMVRAHIEVLTGLGIMPGLQTFNLPLLVQKMSEWNIDLEKVLIGVPFNAMGMQMNPSKVEAEKALQQIRYNNVLVYGVLAGGLLGLDDALHYINSLPNIMGIALGVSRKDQAVSTFNRFRNQ